MAATTSRSSTNIFSELYPLIPHLPDDISARIIALTPLSSHPSLCLVSRSWRSLLLSPHLFHLRSFLPSTSPVLLLSLRTPSNPSLFLLLHHPPLSSSPLLLPSPPNNISTLGSACAPLGPSLHLLGGSINNLPSRSLLTLDLRSRLWSQGPPMSSAREFPAAAAVSGRLFAIGGCLPSSRSWAESLLPSSPFPQWSPLPSPLHLRDKWIHACAVLSGKILAVADRGGLVLDPYSLSWSPVSSALDLGWKGRAAAVDGILYTYDYLGKIKGYDPVRDEWRQVEGLERELPRFLCGATLAGLAGLLCLVWEERGGTRRRRDHKKVEIACAGIEVSRMEDGRLMGKVSWMELAALTVPKGSAVVHCVGMEL